MEFSYDEAKDEVHLAGVIYNGNLFRLLAKIEDNQPIRMVLQKRNKVMVQTLVGMNGGKTTGLFKHDKDALNAKTPKK